MREEPKCDFVIVGLGNPGSNYEKTRHNIGWLVLDELLLIEGKWTSWTDATKGIKCSGDICGKNVTLLKPMTMMNSSGEAVVALQSTFDNTELIVIHDDLDINFSKIKMKFGGGHGGHRGVASIISEKGNSNFHRIRCGIGRPHSCVSVIDFVLGEFSVEEQEGISIMIKESVKIVIDIVMKSA